MEIFHSERNSYEGGGLKQGASKARKNKGYPVKMFMITFFGSLQNVSFFENLPLKYAKLRLFSFMTLKEIVFLMLPHA